MNHTVIPGSYAATAETLANPAYEVMTDLLFRKGLAQRGDNIDDIAATFTMTPAKSPPSSASTSAASTLRSKQSA